MWKRLFRNVQPVALSVANRYLTLQHFQTPPLGDASRGPKNMVPLSLEGVNQRALLDEFEKAKGTESIKGVCVPLTVKYSLLALKNQPFDNKNVNIEKMVSKDAAYGQENERQMFLAAEKLEDSKVGSETLFMEASIAAVREFIMARASKFTDHEKNIYVNSVDVGEAVRGSLVEYIEKHGLQEGQALNYNFYDPWKGGHAVALVMKVGGE